MSAVHNARSVSTSSFAVSHRARNSSGSAPHASTYALVTSHVGNVWPCAARDSEVCVSSAIARYEGSPAPMRIS